MELELLQTLQTFQHQFSNLSGLSNTVEADDAYFHIRALQRIILKRIALKSDRRIVAQVGGGIGVMPHLLSDV